MGIEKSPVCEGEQATMVYLQDHLKRCLGIGTDEAIIVLTELQVAAILGQDPNADISLVGSMARAGVNPRLNDINGDIRTFWSDVNPDVFGGSPNTVLSILRQEPNINIAWKPRVGRDPTAANFLMEILVRDASYLFDDQSYVMRRGAVGAHEKRCLPDAGVNVSLWTHGNNPDTIAGLETIVYPDGIPWTDCRYSEYFCQKQQCAVPLCIIDRSGLDTAALRIAPELTEAYLRPSKIENTHFPNVGMALTATLRTARHVIDLGKNESRKPLHELIDPQTIQGLRDYWTGAAGFLAVPVDEYRANDTCAEFIANLGKSGGASFMLRYMEAIGLSERLFPWLNVPSGVLMQRMSNHMQRYKNPVMDRMAAWYDAVCPKARTVNAEYACGYDPQVLEGMIWLCRYPYLSVPDLP